MSRVSRGRSSRTTAPRSAPAAATDRGRTEMPAPATTRSTMTSRCSVSTAICGDRPAGREGVVGLAAGRGARRGGDEGQAGQRARGVTGSVARRDLGSPTASGGSRTTKSWLSSGWLVEVVADERQLGDADLALPAAEPLADGARVVGLGQSDGHPGMRLAEAADELGGRGDREGGQAHDVEVAGGEPGHLGDRGPGAGGLAQGPPGRAEERLAGRRSRCTVRPWRWNSSTPSSTSRPRTACDTDGCDSSRASAACGEPTLVDHGDHDGELAEIHRNSYRNRLTTCLCTMERRDRDSSAWTRPGSSSPAR